MNQVAILKKRDLRYSKVAPYHPSSRHPECPFPQTQTENLVYDSIRELWSLLRLDPDQFGTAKWNPLGEFIRPGNTVLLKPNFVSHENPEGDVDCLITHGSVIRCILDYVYIALKGEGRIIIGDAPVQGGDFRKIVEHTGLSEIQAHYKRHLGFDLEIRDFRLEMGVKDGFGFITRHKLEANQQECSAVNLGHESELASISSHFRRYRVTNYDKAEMTSHHNNEKHEYLISDYVLASDVIINIPKLKTHRKVGMTCAMKNLVGINASKDWLPHHRTGSLGEGGDEYQHKSARKQLISRLWEMRDTSCHKQKAKFISLLLAMIGKTQLLYPARDPYFEGSWYGNDTLPRTVTDLNRIALYADKTGRMQKEAQRRMLVIVDGIVAGEREGPLSPSPKHCGLIVAGLSPVVVDLVCSRVIGFDYRKIPMFRYAMRNGKYELFCGNPADLLVRSDLCSSYDQLVDTFGCEVMPSAGWRDHIEITHAEEAVQLATA